MIRCNPSLKNIDSPNTEYMQAINNQQLKKIEIAHGNSLFAEPGCMVASNNVTMRSETIAKSIVGSAAASLWSGESVFQNKFSADQGRSGWVALDRDLDLIECTLKPGESLTSIRGSLMARDEDISLTTETQGLSGMWAGTGFITQKLKNEGNKINRVFLENSNIIGSIKEIKVKETDGPVIIDSANIAGYTDGFQMKTFRQGSILSSFASNEGLMNKFTGSGSIFIKVGKKASR